MGSITLTRSEAGGTFEVRISDVVVVEFDEPVTGYRWVSDDSALAREETPYPGGAPGAGGMVTFTYAARDLGVETLQFRFEDRFQSDVAERCTFTIRVVE